MYRGDGGKGRSLKHYRTKGSKNGYSKDPNYRPIGKVARALYNDPDVRSAAANAQRQITNPGAPTSSAMYNDPRYNAKGSEKIAQAKVTAAHKALVSSAAESKARNALGGLGGLASDIMTDKRKNTLQQKIIDAVKDPKKRKKAAKTASKVVSTTADAVASQHAPVAHYAAKKKKK